MHNQASNRQICSRDTRPTRRRTCVGDKGLHRFCIYAATNEYGLFLCKRWSFGRFFVHILLWGCMDWTAITLYQMKRLKITVPKSSPQGRRTDTCFIHTNATGGRCACDTGLSTHTRLSNGIVQNGRLLRGKPAPEGCITYTGPLMFSYSISPDTEYNNTTLRIDAGESSL